MVNGAVAPCYDEGRSRSLGGRVGGNYLQWDRNSVQRNYVGFHTIEMETLLVWGQSTTDKVLLFLSSCVTICQTAYHATFALFSTILELHEDHDLGPSQALVNS